MMSGPGNISDKDMRNIKNEVSHAQGQPMPGVGSLVTLFEKVVAEKPDHCAVRFGDKRISFKELDLRGNELAHRLVRSGLATGQIVGVSCRPGIERIVAILGILKAGGAYMPLEGDLPVKRLQFMQQDGDIRHIVCDVDVGCFDKKIARIFVNEGGKGIPKGPEIQLTGDSPAYVLYTSGSTGQPKGVQISHGNIISLIAGLHHIDFASHRTMLMAASYGFDASTFEIWGGLLNGLTLYQISKEDLLSPEAIRSHLNKVCLGIFTTSLFHHLTQYDPTIFSSLKTLLTGGEVLGPLYVKKFLASCPDVKLLNCYGPTENTVIATVFQVDRQYDRMPIGTPIANTSAYVVDTQTNECLSTGDIGELWLGGDGLSKGYLGRPQLNSTKFIANPFGDGMLYRTGDLARWRGDGTLDFMGRIDEQIKIRGLRVEPGEIEQQIMACNGIDEAKVVARDVGGDKKRLIAYFTATVPINLLFLKKELAENLPSWMIPALQQINHIPLKSSGKIDLERLPLPKEGFSLSEYIPPSTVTESLVCDAWAKALNIERVGKTDDFFDLGGTSLDAIMISYLLKATLNRSIALKQIFQYPTPQQLSQEIDDMPEDQEGLIVKAKEKDLYPASSGQKRFWALQDLDATGIAYNIRIVFKVNGCLDTARLEEAWGKLVERHGVLRTTFVIVNGELYQKVSSKLNCVIETIETKQARIESVINQHNTPFDLTQGPLYRVKYFKTGIDCGRLMISMHHSIVDGFSMQTLLQELTELYRDGRIKLAKPEFRYIDYATHQLRQQNHQKSKEYWLQELGEDVPLLELPYDYARPKNQDFRGSTVTIEIPQPLRLEVLRFEKECGATLNTIMFAAYAVFLSHITGQSDLVIGYPTAGRNKPEWTHIVGLFINTLCARISTNSDVCFAEWTANFNEKHLKNLDHQDYAFERLVEEVKFKRDPGRNPLFDTMFSLQDWRFPTQLANELEMKEERYPGKVARMDLLCQFQVHAQEMYVDFEYPTALFNDSTIRQLSHAFLDILSGLLSNPYTPMGKINWLCPKLENEDLSTSGKISGKFIEKSIVELFRSQVKINPMATAIAHGDSSIDYQDLDLLSDSLAGELLSKGLAVGEIIGISVKPGIDRIVAALGILKAGGAYMPMDSELPADRLLFMAKDAEIKILVCDSDIDSLPAETTRVFMPQSVSHSRTPLPCNTSPESTALVMYTSGSTGTPKGVLVSHGNVLNLVQNQNYVDFSQHESMFVGANFSFDASSFEIWGGLLNGLTLQIVSSDDLLAVNRLRQHFRKCDVAFITTPLFHHLVQLDPKVFAPLKTLLVGGEVLNPVLAGVFRNACPLVSFANIYGPTENTTFSACFPINDEKFRYPIGQPLCNTTAYIVDQKTGQLLVNGAIGELWLGGAGVAKGYLNRPELTLEKFSANPFGSGRVYKTGDLVRWNAAGDLEFFGRVDDQIKIRGLRIEPLEIEHCLLKCPGIKEAKVVARRRENSSESILCGYFTAYEKMDCYKVAEQIARKLPDWMVPQLIQLDTIPLKKNCKVDLDQLPLPGKNEQQPSIPPRNKIEKTLCDIWHDVLDVDGIGIRDNFFALGGSSLSGMKLASIVSTVLNQQLPFRAILEHTTIETQATYLQTQGSGFTPLNPLECSDSQSYSGLHPVSAAQIRLFILHNMSLHKALYNIPLTLEFQKPISIDRFRDTWQQLIRRHEPLRTAFVSNRDGVFQSIDDNAEVRLEAIDCSEDDIEALLVKNVKDFDLDKAPLFRVKLFMTPNKTVALLDFHHIIADGSSMELLLQEFSVLYNGGELKPLSRHYRDYSHWHNSFSNSAEVKKKVDYWTNLFGDKVPVLSLPTDYPRPARRDEKGQTISLNIGEAEDKALRRTARAHGVSLQMYCMAAFYVLLSRYSRQQDIVVGIPVAGRNHPDTQDMIGMFVNTLPIRMNLNGDGSFADLLQDLRLTLATAYDHQDVPFERVVDALKIQRDQGRNPLYDVLFNFVDYRNYTIVLDEIKGEYRKWPYPFSKFDLNVFVEDNDSNLTIAVEFSTSLFATQTIERMLKHYRNILTSTINNAACSLNSLNMLEEQERRQVLDDFNDTKTPYDRSQLIHRLIESRAQKSPNAIAVSDGILSYTYADLNRRANQLAHGLRDMNQGKFVGVLMNRSTDIVTATLGILKSGSAYIPIDPSWPVERIAGIFSEANVRTIVTDSAQRKVLETLAKRLPSLKNAVIFGEWGQNRDPFDHTILQNSLDSYSDENLDTNDDPQSLAYIIFTSGTTGKPKGVMVRHTRVINLIEWFNRVFKIGHGDKILFVTSVCFDLSVYDMFGILAAGGLVRVATDQEIREPERLVEILEDESITLWDSAPAALMRIVPLFARLKDHHALKLRQVFLSGDWIPINLPDEIRKCFPKSSVISLGGATEATVWSNYFPISEVQKDWPSIPYGKPIQNARYYILDQNQMPCPVGVPGDLYIGGECLADGYFNQTKQTEERFLTDPFVPTDGAKMYKTGDLARWFSDGNMQFLGREDNQVKIRGYRIECGEIEFQLNSHPEIRNALVMPLDHHDGTRVLGAYLIRVNPQHKIDFKAFLGEKIPEYMIPHFFFEMTSFPVTANGKVARDELPRPDGAKKKKTRMATGNEIESVMAGLWCDLLDNDEIGFDENFFEVGGNSILLVRLVADIDKIWPRTVRVVDFFANPTIKKISFHIRKALPSKNHADSQPPQLGSQEISSFVNRIRDLPQIERARIYKELAAAASTVESESELLQKSQAFTGEGCINDEIAIIGLAINLPSCKSNQSLWSGLSQGHCFIGDLPESRADACRLYLEKKGVDLDIPIRFQKGAYLDNINEFDHEIYGITEKEALLMAPSHRLFLDTTMRAIEEAGLGGGRLDGKNAAVIAAVSHVPSDLNYSEWISAFEPGSSLQSITGTLDSVLPGRVSHLLNLKGPAYNVDTACSSGLVAVHLAANHLRRGEVDVAIVGGVKLHLLPLEEEDRIGIESADGWTRSFDDDSGGTSLGEGSISLVMRPLADAVKDNDYIYGTIKGGAINHDGNSISITAPNANAQAEVIVKAWNNAEINPEEISYIETHGTATKLGDPIEIVGITSAFENFTSKKQFCSIGSVKTNFGHLDALSGLLGLTKTLISMKNQMLAPSLHFNTPNREIPFVETPVYVQDHLSDWEKNSGSKRLCGVSSFGMSGTNCHLVLGEHPKSQPVETTDNNIEIITISSTTEQGIFDQLEDWQNWLLDLAEKPKLIDLAFSSSVGRTFYKVRLVIVAQSIPDLQDSIAVALLSRKLHNPLKGIYCVKNGVVIDPGKDPGGHRLSHINWQRVIHWLKGENTDWSMNYANKSVRRCLVPITRRRKCTVAIENCAAHVGVELIGSESATNPYDQGVAELWSEILHISKFLPEDDFFDLGGNSLDLNILRNRIKTRLNVDIPLSKLYTYATISGHGQLVSESEKITADPIHKVKDRGVFALAPAQQNIVLASLKAGGDDLSYNMPMILSWQGPLDVERLTSCWNMLLQRHDVLRTAYQFGDDTIYQVVQPHEDVEIRLISTDENTWRETVSQEIKPFDLEQDRLARLAACRVEHNRYIIFIDQHHSISDGVSTAILLKELYHLYAGKILPHREIHYSDYCAWLNEGIDSGKYDGEIDYWRQKMEDVVALPPLNTSVSETGIKGARVNSHLTCEESRNLDRFTEQSGLSKYSVLLGVFHLLLWRLFGKEDLVIGSPVAGRPHEDLEEMIGMFVNMLPMRNDVDDQLSCFEYIDRVMKNSIEGFENQAVNVEYILSDRPLDQTLFQHSFALQNLDMGEQLLGDALVTPLPFYELEWQVSKFDLSLFVVEIDQKYELSFEYRTGLFSEDQVSQLFTAYKAILAFVIESPTSLVCEVPAGFESPFQSHKKSEASEFDFDLDFES